MIIKIISLISNTWSEYTCVKSFTYSMKMFFSAIITFISSLNSYNRLKHKLF